MKEYQDYFASNKDIWNQRTTVHKDSDFYNRAGFKAGKNVLTPIELNELGDVNGKSMLHLQCHFGMDSLNWVRLGATVTGVDLSDTAITEANRLSAEMNLPAKFICCNVYDLPQHLDEQYDIVFASYGVVGWLPDLDSWAKIVARFIKPGGIFYLADFHPVVWMMDEDLSHIKYYYDNRELIVTENEGTYTDRNATIDGKEYSWNHSLSEIINSLINAGLKIEQFNEYMYSPYPCFRNIVETNPGEWQVKGLEGKIPMVYTVKCSR